MKKLFFLFLLHVMFATLAIHPALAARVNMRARQPIYGTEFDVYRTADMPANWFKTYDGYYVTRRIDANWVYGRVTPNGVEFTDIIVGSLDPRGIPELNVGMLTPAYAPKAQVYMPPTHPAAMYNGPAVANGPIYIPPAPWAAGSRGKKKTGLAKVRDPEYQRELKEIIKDLKVVGPISTNLSIGALVSDLKNHVASTFGEQTGRPGERGAETFNELAERFMEERLSSQGANVYDYSYPYLTRHHFPTKLPLDFHILHDRVSGQVEFYVTMGAKGGFRSFNISQKDILGSSRILQYLEKSYQYVAKDFSAKDIRFSPDIVFHFDYGEDKTREMDESDFYLLTPLPFEDEGVETSDRWYLPYSTYGLRLATTASSSLLPMPTYESLMQKIAKAERVRVFSHAGDFTHYDRKSTWKLLGIIELAAIDQKNRFTKSMEARYETYKKIVELEERWQGTPEELERITHLGTWPLDKALDADWIYNVLMTESIHPLMTEFTELFGDPEVSEHTDPRSNLVIAHVKWARGVIHIDFDYIFQGGRWNANRWDASGRPYVTELWRDGQQAFAKRLREFTEMLGQPKLKQSSRVVWFIGDYDEAKFTIEQSGNALIYRIGKRQSMEDWDKTFIDPVK